MISYVLALLATIGVEFPILWRLTRSSLPSALLYAAIINALTQPIANYVYHNVFGTLWLIELAVALVESVLIMLLFRLRYARAALVSVAANLASTLIGVVWQAITR